MKFSVILLVLALLINDSYSQSVLYEKGQNGFGFFGSYSGDVYTNTFGLGCSYTYNGKIDFSYSYGYTTPKPNSDALYAKGNRFSLSYLFRKNGELGSYAIEPGAGFSFGRDQKTAYRVISGGLSLYKPIILNDISGLIPEFSLGARLIMDTEYRYVMTFGASILYHIRASKREKSTPYISGGVILTNYGSFYYIKLGIALNSK